MARLRIVGLQSDLTAIDTGEDTGSMAIVAAETDYGEVVGEGDGSGDTL
jgi:hypothetical protein